MFTVHSGGGAQDYSIEDPCVPSDQWEIFRKGTLQLLDARGYYDASELLNAYPFKLMEGSNFFGDEFVVLHAPLPIQKYADVVEKFSDPMEKHASHKLQLR